MRRFVSVLAMAAMTGCAPRVPPQAVLDALVGQPESEAIRVLGIPDRTLSANGHQFLGYDVFGPYWSGWYLQPNYPVLRRCQATLDVVGGRVASWALHGDAC